MKICVAQINSVIGNIPENISKHLHWINQGKNNGADLIIFSELSLSGYEPTLAESLAMTTDDERLSVFQEKSNQLDMCIGIGLPTKASAGVCISLLLFQPFQNVSVYSKKYLHADEELYFVSGENFSTIAIQERHISFAICYELSIPEHSALAHQQGTEIYIASVAKIIPGVDKAHKELSSIAQKYQIPVMMSNCVGTCEGKVAGGRSAVWNAQGILLNELSATGEGLITYDL